MKKIIIFFIILALILIFSLQCDTPGESGNGSSGSNEGGSSSSSSSTSSSNSSSSSSSLPSLPQYKVIAPDAYYWDEFGSSVSISGDYAIVGAWKEDEAGGDSGAVYFFHRIDTNTWDAGIKKIAPSGGDDDNFGISVSISGDYAIVGASGVNVNTGAAYIYHRTGTNTWDRITGMKASDYYDNFGISVSISGDYAIIGAYGDDNNTGAVYIYHRTGVDSWTSKIKITAPDAEQGDSFGCSVSISGDYAIVGAMGEDEGGVGSGAAYIFHRTGTNTWDAGTKITASSASMEDFFGVAVAISGDYAIVGATGEDAIGTTNSGAAFIFHRTGTNSWDTGIKITAFDANDNDSFGISVSISGDYAIVGANWDDNNTGAAYIYHKIGTNSWDTGTKITAFDASSGSNFGFSVCISEGQTLPA